MGDLNTQPLLVPDSVGRLEPAPSSKRHPDRFSRFCTAQVRGQQTDTPHHATGTPSVTVGCILCPECMRCGLIIHLYIALKPDDAVGMQQVNYLLPYMHKINVTRVSKVAVG